ncbi:hypothetical protein [Priestia endophytica]|uniref:hypothetical protein n=1 Tax=Priestia endophytica TaxID=135735 RepID=UPI000F934800|nr:hypothetical protein [Priestia endophytica]RPK01452.1 hypothetical protein FH5_02434 [Priestia endophytica]
MFKFKKSNGLFKERGQAYKAVQFIKNDRSQKFGAILYIGIQEGEEGTFCVNGVDDKKLWKIFF